MYISQNLHIHPKPQKQWKYLNQHSITIFRINGMSQNDKIVIKYNFIEVMVNNEMQ